MIDISRNGKEIPWQEKKTKTFSVAESFDRLGNFNKARKLRDCGTFLAFKRYLADNSLKLHSANFCKIRLCPLCSWRRSLKIFGQVSQIMNVAQKEKEHEFLFLTLTVKNCPGKDLSKTLDMMLQGYDKMFKRACIKKAILGSFRALEITHNTNKYSQNYDTYHPHFHCVLMVNKSYFNGHLGNYLTQQKWVDLWQDVIGADYAPLVDIRKIDKTGKGIEKAVAEVAKYSVKDADFLSPDEALQDKAIMVLDEALANRRLISFRGEFAKIQKQLALDDALDGDLVHCDGDDELRSDLEFVIEKYRWNVGYRQYCLLDDNNEFANVAADADADAQ